MQAFLSDCFQLYNVLEVHMPFVFIKTSVCVLLCSHCVGGLQIFNHLSVCGHFSCSTLDNREQCRFSFVYFSHMLMNRWSSQ